MQRAPRVSHSVIYKATTKRNKRNVTHLEIRHSKAM